MLDAPNEWKSRLGEIQYILNNTYHSVVRSTPSQLMLGYSQRNFADFPFAQFTQALAGVDFDLQTNRQLKRDIAEVATELVKNYNRKYCDSKAKKPTMYKEGQYVMIRDLRAKVGGSGKLKGKYRGPYIIRKCLGHNRYVVQDIPAFNHTQKPLETVLSSDKLKPWIEYGPPDRKQEM